MLNTVLQRQLQRSLGIESVDIDINIGDEKPVTDDAGAIASPIAEDGEPLAEAQQVDLAEEENEVEDTNDHLEDTNQDVETLESLISVLQMGLENNSTDPALFKAVNVTMDHIARKRGFVATAFMPSMEAYGANPQVSMEEAAEKAKGILSTLKSGAADLVAKLWYQVKKFCFNVAQFLRGRVKSRAESLIKQADKMTQPVKKIKVYNAKLLKYGEKGVATPAEMKNLVNNLFNNAGKIVDLVSLTTTKLAEDIAAGKSSADNQLAQLAAKFSSKEAKPNGDLYLGFGNASVTFVGTAVSHTGTTGEKSSVTTLTGVKLVTPGNKSDDVETTSASQSEVKELCGYVVRLIELTTTKGVKMFNDRKLEKTVTENIKKAQGAAVMDSNTLADTEKSIAAFKDKDYKQAVKVMIKLQNDLISYYGQVCKALVDFCAQSVAVGTGKTAEVKDKEAAPAQA